MRVHGREFGLLAAVAGSAIMLNGCTPHGLPSGRGVGVDAATVDAPSAPESAAGYRGPWLDLLRFGTEQSDWPESLGPHVEATALPSSEWPGCVVAMCGALSLLPGDLLRREIDGIHFLETLRLADKPAPTGSMIKGRRIFITVGLGKRRPRVDSMEEAIAVAAALILCQNHPEALDTERWRALNPPEFVYRVEGPDPLGDPPDAEPPPGKFYGSATPVSLETDFACIAAAVLRSDGRLYRDCEASPSLAQKLDLVVQFLSALDAGVDADRLRTGRSARAAAVPPIGSDEEQDRYGGIWTETGVVAWRNGLFAPRGDAEGIRERFASAARIDSEVTEAQPAAYERAKAIICAAMERYSLPVVMNHLEGVSIVGRMRLDYCWYGGTYRPGRVVIATDRLEKYGDDRVATAFHHEFSSVLLHANKRYLDLEAWRAANPPGFEYVRPDYSVSAYRGFRVGAVDDALAEQGFLCMYSLSDEENDFNCIAGALWSGDPALWRAKERFPRLSAKVDLTIAFYGELDSRFSVEFFRSLVRRPASD